MANFPQFSRKSHKVSWPKFACPDLRASCWLLPQRFSWASLDVSTAFYPIPLNPTAGVPGLEGLHACTPPAARWGLPGELHHSSALRENLELYEEQTLMLVQNYGD